MLRIIAFLLWIPLASAAVTYSYDDAGRLIKVDYGDGRTIAYTYDPAGNLLSRTSTAAAGASSANNSKPEAKAEQARKPAAGSASPAGSPQKKDK